MRPETVFVPERRSLVDTVIQILHSVADEDIVYEKTEFVQHSVFNWKPVEVLVNAGFTWWLVDRPVTTRAAAFITRSSGKMYDCGRRANSEL